MPVIATAGHVDHGKSTLIEALTGRDPDRWAEEKRRGLTIDLGFAWMSLPDGRDVSFVDVPGHSRFVANMLAGVGSVDAALLVVAADEGWMPQTEEHLAVLDLLEVTHAVVALTKVDRVDPEVRSTREIEIRDQLAGTSLANAPVVALSARSGEGLSELVAHLAELTREPNDRAGTPRLWVDRSFTISGAGTVVTGTLVGGSLERGHLVDVWPLERRLRIRQVQVHEHLVERAAPSNRVAINLADVDKDLVGRGSLVGDSIGVYNRFRVDLRLARYADPIEARGSHLLHVGTHVTPVRVANGTLRTQDPVPLIVGDRFIIRDPGRRQVVGGGRVLAVVEPRRKTVPKPPPAPVELPKVEDDANWQRAREQLRESGFTPPTLRSLELEGDVLRVLVRDGHLVRITDDLALLPETVDAARQILAGLGDFTVSDFRTAAGISRKYAVPILEHFDREGITLRSGDQRTLRR